MTVALASSSTFDLLNACLQNLGAAILPLWGVNEKGHCLCPKGEACGKNAGKHPNPRLAPNGVKNATRDPAIIRQWVRQAPGGNWALRCGEPLPGGGFLGVLDEDPRNGSEESLAQIRAGGDELPETVTQSTGGGGSHRLYRFPHAPAGRTVGPGLDLQGADKYIVIAPSRHYTRSAYTWDLGLAPGSVEVAKAPPWLLDGTAQAMPRPASDGGTGRETVLGEAFALSGRAGAVMPDGMMLVNCPQSDQHSDARGRGEDASTVILPPAGGSRFGGFRCMHSHCQNLKWQDVLKLLPPEHVDAAYKRYPRLAVVPKDAQAPVEEAPTPGPSEELDLSEVTQRTHYKRTQKGDLKLPITPTPDILNGNVILTYDPRWKGTLQFDEFAQQLRMLKPPPWHADDAPRDQSRVWTDNHVSCLDLWFRRYYRLELPISTIRELVYVVGKRDSINPLRDYLVSLKWDGIKRIDTWLTEYLGTDDTPYTRAVGRKWLISAVARGYQPGCSAHHVLILEGKQGKGKSTAVRSLVPESSWFSDTPIPIGDKDAYVGMRGKWIIELAELASLKKADLEKAKAFFTAPVDSYRPPYGREQVSIPRTCVFVGTVNPDEYLQDSTGARRFWPVKVGVIDIKRIVEDRDQLWAEASAEYMAWVERGSKSSECPWWPTPEEVPTFEKEQAAREVVHPWGNRVASWLKTDRAQTIVASRGYLLSTEILSQALDVEVKDMTLSMTTTIGIVMVGELGWTKKRITMNGARTYGYYPPLTES